MLPCSFCFKKYTQNYRQYNTRIGKVLKAIEILIPRIKSFALMILTIRETPFILSRQYKQSHKL
jgi:hypothetical protein